MGANMSKMEQACRTMSKRTLCAAVLPGMAPALWNETNRPSFCITGNPTKRLESMPRQNVPSTTQRTECVLLEPPVLMQHHLSKHAKRNVVLLGLTGAGKSQTACKMTYSNTFTVNDSMVSVTSKVQYQDVPQGWLLPPATYRVIDTPGFFDTTMTQEQVAESLKEFAGVAREGLAAILIVVRNGRFTQENQAVLKFVELVLGREALAKYGVLVVTHTSKSSQQLKNEFDALPECNLGRQIANVVAGRIVPLDLKTPPSGLFDMVEKVFAQNGYMALDCDMMNFERVKMQQEAEFEALTLALRTQHGEEKQHLEEQIERYSEEKQHLSEEKQHLEERMERLKSEMASLSVQSQHRVQEITSFAVREDSNGPMGYVAAASLGALAGGIATAATLCTVM